MCGMQLGCVITNQTIILQEIPTATSYKLSQKSQLTAYARKIQGASTLGCEKQLSHRWDDKSHVYGLAASEFTVTINLEGLMSV